MEKNNIILHQAYYGEVDRSHSCIKQTINDAELKSFLISFTDRPAALPPNTILSPYLSGAAFSKYYVFSKTFPDVGASRAGMVFTHVLIISINDIDSIIRVDDILDHFIVEIPLNTSDLREIDLKFSKDSVSVYDFQPSYVQQSISTLIKEKSPILFSGNIESFKIILQQFWNSQIKGFKNKIKFRASFTPSDIEKLNDLTIVSIQKEFLSKWNNKEVILDNENIQIEITNGAEKLFLGFKENNPFYDFLMQLNLNLDDLSILAKSHDLYSFFVDLDKINDVNLMRSQIRQISQISSVSNDGKHIKTLFLDKLESFYTSKKDLNFKALRNINWSSFDLGELRLKKILSEFISTEFKKTKEIEVEILSELLSVSIEDKSKSTWHFTILENFKNLFSIYNSAVYANIWTFINFSDASLKNIFTICDSTNKNETNLRKNIPFILEDNTVNMLLDISKNRKWYLLHADLLLKSMKAEVAILEQIEIEKELLYEDSLGVLFIADQLNDVDFINLTVCQNNEKLILISVDRILKDKNLLENINLRNSTWIKIWSSVLNKNQDISDGIESKTQEIVFTVYDLIIDNISIPKIIMDLISQSPFADLSNYTKREILWEKLPSEHLHQFLRLTAEDIVEKILTDEIRISLIEDALLHEIKSDLFMSHFLNKNKNEIDKVIKIYSSLHGLKDRFLADYIFYYNSSISLIEAKKLGNLVSRNSYSLSAKSVYDKSKHNSTFKPAFGLCSNLVPLNILESIFGFFNKYDVSDNSKNYKFNTYMEKTLPTVVILTAIKEEFSAVKNHLKTIIDCDKDGTAYERGNFELNGKEIANVIIRECGAKNTIASQEAERAIRNFNPNMILFVGIAGSRKPNDFKIGDVIFPEKIYSYESGKAARDSFKARPDSVSPTYTLIEKAKKERSRESWKDLIKGNYEINPNADIGIIASGEQLIDHHDTDIGLILKEHYNDSSVVEMEGYGFAKAINRQGNTNIVFGVVRGISDVVEEDSNQKELENDRRPENAKTIAADTASAFAYWLIYKFYE